MLRKLGTRSRVARQVERDIGPLTEGYLPRDLQAIATRALHACWSRRHEHRAKERDRRQEKGQRRSRQNGFEQQMQEASIGSAEYDEFEDEYGDEFDENCEDDKCGVSNISCDHGPIMCDVSTALRGYVASNLRAANLDDSSNGNSGSGGGNNAWQSLGGMASQMRELEEMIDLPTRYAPLFNLVRVKDHVSRRRSDRTAQSCLVQCPKRSLSRYS